ncbi:MAG: HEAT repeat domain-containing protein [Cyanophyceae cyanobacterium]
MKWLSVLILSLFLGSVDLLLVQGKVVSANSCSSSRLESLIEKLKVSDSGIQNIVGCGSMAADLLINYLNDENKELRARAIYSLGEIGANDQLSEKSNRVVQLFIELLDTEKEVVVRTQITYALGHVGKSSESALYTLIALLRNPSEFNEAKTGAAFSLRNIRLNEQDAIDALILALEDSSNLVQSEAASSLGAWSTDIKLSREKVVKALIKLLTDDSSGVQISAAKALGKMVTESYIRSTELEEVKTAINLVSLVNSALAKPSLSTGEIDVVKKSVSQNLQDLQNRAVFLALFQYFSSFQKLLSIHSVIWLTLIFLYPKFRPIQAFILWHPWMRRFFGAGYVGLALTWIPFLRQKLFEPFRESLLADADLFSFEEEAYFPSVSVSRKGKEDVQVLQAAIPEFKGQILLEGASGLGKTIFLRYLCHRSKRIVVYLLARRCQDGVIQAIQEKLHGEKIKDSRFLRDLIYSGAITICIDGLNEVNADTRAKIVEFTENYFKGDIILATQPMDWQESTTARKFIIQPLDSQQIQGFLLSRATTLPKNKKLQGEDYKQACRKFLSEALEQETQTPELVAMRRILSNPMDLSTVSLMVASKIEPKLFQLQQQLYDTVAEEYQAEQGKPFPIKKFAETVYQMRLDDATDIPEKKFLAEIGLLVEHRMVIVRQSVDSEGSPSESWRFRHDKVMEFFLVRALREYPDRQTQHLNDPRFQGAYFMLANVLEVEDAMALREILLQNAADTKEHTVSDEFIRLLRARRV